MLNLGYILKMLYMCFQLLGISNILLYNIIDIHVILNIHLSINILSISK